MARTLQAVAFLLLAVEPVPILGQSVCSPVPITIPFTISGKLDISDCLQSGYYSDRYMVNLQAGLQITIEASAPSTTTLSWLTVDIHRWISAGPNMGWNRVLEQTEYTPERRALKFDFQAPFSADYLFLITGGTSLGTYTFSLKSLNATSPGTCTPDMYSVCLLNNRFRAQVRYRSNFDNNAADAQALAKTTTGFSESAFETGFFYFNSSNNAEVMVKMLDQGNTFPDGRRAIAVLTGTATPLRVEVTITDTSFNGETKTYVTEFGKQSGVTDFTAFAK